MENRKSGNIYRFIKIAAKKKEDYKNPLGTWFCVNVL